MTTALVTIGIIVMALALLAAAICDVRRYEIPDSITIVILIGLALYGLGTPDFNWPSHLASGGLMFAFGLLAFQRGWLGGGDVKIMTACACWAGLDGILMQFLAISVAGGILAIMLLAIRRLHPAARRSTDEIPRLLQANAPLPYAIAIATGMSFWASLGGVPLV